MKVELKTKEDPKSFAKATADVKIPDPPAAEAEAVIESLVLSAIAPIPEYSELDSTLAEIDSCHLNSRDGTKLLSLADAVRIFGSYASAKTKVDTLRDLGVRVAIIGDHQR